MACDICGAIGFFPRCEECQQIARFAPVAIPTRRAPERFRVVTPLPDAAFEAKVTGILARGFVDALRLQREHEEHASGPPANVDDRDATTGLPIAAVGDVRDHSDAEAAACVVGYNRALADSLKSAEQILDKLAEEHWSLADLVAHIKERLAEDSGRLGWSFSGDDLLREVGRVGVKGDVVTRGG